MLITSSQARMARAALRLTVKEVAGRARVAPNTVSRFENDHDIHGSNRYLIAKVFEEAGLMFLDNDGEHGFGVRYAKR